MQNVQQLVVTAFKECTKTDWLWLRANKETSNTHFRFAAAQIQFLTASSRTNLQGILGFKSAAPLIGPALPCVYLHKHWYVTKDEDVIKASHLITVFILEAFDCVRVIQDEK